MLFSCKSEYVLLLFCIFVSSFEHCYAQAQEETPGCELDSVCTSQSDCPDSHFCHELSGLCAECEVCCDKVMVSPGTCWNKCNASEHISCSFLRTPKPSQQCKNDYVAANTCALIKQNHLVTEIMEENIAQCRGGLETGKNIDCKPERYSELTDACTTLNWEICRFTLGFGSRGTLSPYACLPFSCESMFEEMFFVPGVTVEVECGERARELLLQSVQLPIGDTEHETRVKWIVFCVVLLTLIASSAVVVAIVWYKQKRRGATSYVELQELGNPCTENHHTPSVSHFY